MLTECPTKDMFFCNVLTLFDKIMNMVMFFTHMLTP